MIIGVSVSYEVSVFELQALSPAPHFPTLTWEATPLLCQVALSPRKQGLLGDVSSRVASSSRFAQGSPNFIIESPASGTPSLHTSPGGAGQLLL